MNIKGRFYIYPEDESDIESILLFLNKETENELFLRTSKHITNTKLAVVSEEMENKMKEWADEKKFHSILIWNSDDIDSCGLDFYNYKTHLRCNVEQPLSSKEFILLTDFMTMCGMKNMIEREII